MRINSRPPPPRTHTHPSIRLEFHQFTSLIPSMTSHQYEVALFGEFFSKDLKPILNRITLHCESSEPMHSREVVFEPLDAQKHRDQGQEPTLLRARKELIVNGKKVDGPWCVSNPPWLLHPANPHSQAPLLVSETRVGSRTS